MFKTIMWQFYGVKGQSPLRGARGSAPRGGSKGQRPLVGSKGQRPWRGPTVNPLPCLIGELSFKILNVNEISQSNYEFLNLFKTYRNIQLKPPFHKP